MKQSSFSYIGLILVFYLSASFRFNQDAQQEVVVEFPSSFSPNNDGKDDFFVPLKLVGVKKAELKIFNRWGMEIFTGTDMQKGWNGMKDKEQVPEGNYFWKFSCLDAIGNETNLTGYVSLIRS